MNEQNSVTTTDTSIHSYVDTFFEVALKELAEGNYDSAKDYGFRAVAAALRIDDPALHDLVTALSKEFSMLVDLSRVVSLAEQVQREKGEEDPVAAKAYIQKVVAESQVLLSGISDPFQKYFGTSVEALQSRIQELNQFL